jgi:hypothetical protein
MGREFKPQPNGLAANGPRIDHNLRQEGDNVATGEIPVAYLLAADNVLRLPQAV